MGVKTCPECGLLIDERFRFCECGYDWLDEPHPRRKPQMAKTDLGPLATTVIVLLVGVAVTFILAFVRLVVFYG
ncbi:MAG: hypothetical protein IT450_17230 [Phycisphaerales bacterium]|nr:hypothetical protein [Phycisphaerales bacterium]